MPQVERSRPIYSVEINKSQQTVSSHHIESDYSKGKSREWTLKKEKKSSIFFSNWMRKEQNSEWHFLINFDYFPILPKKRTCVIFLSPHYHRNIFLSLFSTIDPREFWKFFEAFKSEENLIFFQEKSSLSWRNERGKDTSLFSNTTDFTLNEQEQTSQMFGGFCLWNMKKMSSRLEFHYQSVSKNRRYLGSDSESIQLDETCCRLLDSMIKESYHS